MKIAQIAPVWESESLLSTYQTLFSIGSLTSELIARGHDVSLFTVCYSSQDRQSPPKHSKVLHSIGSSAASGYIQSQTLDLKTIFNHAHKFDLIHSHAGHSAFPYANFCQTPVIHTLHDLISSETENQLIQHAHQNFVSVSKSQRRSDLSLNYWATIHNAIAVNGINFYSRPAQSHYLAFVDNISADTGAHLAIKMAKKAGLPLKIAEKIRAKDRHYFEQVISPQIDGHQIQLLRDVNYFTRIEVMGRAVATLFPSPGQEPFAYAMAESLATGTPVISMNTGFANEMIIQGKTGFLYGTTDDGIQAMHQARSLDRWRCRRHVALKFSIERMVERYESLYRALTSTRNPYTPALLAG